MKREGDFRSRFSQAPEDMERNGRAAIVAGRKQIPVLKAEIRRLQRRLGMYEAAFGQRFKGM